MSLKIRQAQQQFDDSNSQKAFRSRIATPLPKTEIVIDHDSIKALPGTANLRDMWHAGEQPVPAYLYWILCDTNPYTCAIFNDICTAFEQALPDAMSKEAAAEEIQKLVIQFGQDDALTMDTLHASLDVKKDGKTWTFTIKKNWAVHLDISGFPGINWEKLKTYIFNNL